LVERDRLNDAYCTLRRMSRNGAGSKLELQEYKLRQNSFDAYFKQYIEEQSGVKMGTANVEIAGGMRIEAVLDF
jgi:hypothetical protein